jgi:hypothetical protein
MPQQRCRNGSSEIFTPCLAARFFGAIFCDILLILNRKNFLAHLWLYVVRVWSVALSCIGQPAKSSALYLGIPRTKLLKVVAVAAALVAAGAANAAIVSTIDLFNFEQATLTDNTVTGAVSSEVGFDSSILGGYRELILDLKASTNPVKKGARMGVDGVSGTLDFSTDVGASATGIVRWDGQTAVTGGAINAVGLGGENIGNIYTDFFQLDVEFADGAYSFRIDAYTDATNWTSVEIKANQHLTPTTSYIQLAAFLDCGNAFPPGPPDVIVTCHGSGVDFSNLGALQAVIDPSGTATSLDLSLNSVHTVPEPTGIALAGLALLGLGAASRRRKV